MGSLAVGRINRKKLDGILDDLMKGFERDFYEGAVPEFIEIYGGPGEERQYIVDGLIRRTGKIVWEHQEETEGGGVYRIDLDWFLRHSSKR